MDGRKECYFVTLRAFFNYLMQMKLLNSEAS